MTTDPDTPVQKKLTAAVSWRATNLVNKLYSANISADTRAHKEYGEKTVTPGCKIIKTPRNPAQIANHLRQLTFSPRIGSERAATNKG